MITKIVKIIHELIGCLSGMMLFYYCFFMVIIGIDLNLKVDITSSSAFFWLIFGSCGIFIIGGHYLIYSILMGEIERIRDIKIMKYLFFTYIIWVFVGGIIDLLDLYIPYLYVYGGLLINVIVIFYSGRIPITHNKSNQIEQSD